jgi:prevent-host-death family protein
MTEVGALDAKNRLSQLLDLLEGGEEIVITRHGRAVARLVPPTPAFDREQAHAAIKRLWDRAAALKGKTTLDEIKAYRDEGRW